MKKLFLNIILMCVFIFGFSGVAIATPSDFAGGVNDEYEYEEVVFLSGEPVKFTGEIDITERERSGSKSISYKFNLTPEDKNISGKLSRKISYEIQYDNHEDKGQTIARYSVKSYSETVTIGQDKFSLEDFQFSKSDIIDNRPASDFYSGTIKGRKYYEVNKGEGKLILDISGGNAGYENFWGSTETQLLEYYLQMDGQIEDEDGDKESVSWEGTVNVSVSDSLKKILRYADNEAMYSSFPGGHMKISQREMFSRYEYNLPKIKDRVPDKKRRNKGTKELSREMLPRIEKLIIPKFKDTGGHWAEEDIKKLYSLDVFEGNSVFFVPDVAMTRVDFTRAVMKACNIRVEEESKRTSRRSKKEVQEDSLFKDINVDDSNYTYVKDAVNKGIINGAEGLFMPDALLTRAQAITILIRALGFENNAPTPGYFTSFTDDHEIPYWSRDSIYVAREIGLVKGDKYQRVNPSKEMTRAEASVMLIRFLDFLQEDLQKDYRENIMLYN